MSDRFELSQPERRKANRMVKFLAVIHMPAYLRSRIAAIAPSLDFNYLIALRAYKEENSEVTDTAMKSVFNHLWYVTSELVVLAIFDESLSEKLRKAMVDRLLEFPYNCQTFPPEKVKFPSSIF